MPPYLGGGFPPQGRIRLGTLCQAAGGVPPPCDTATLGVLLDAPATPPCRCPASTYWITSSAQTRSVGGKVIPSVCAVFRLRINSNFMDCSTGRSAGFAPFRILST
jgi:hypothetical protein